MSKPTHKTCIICGEAKPATNEFYPYRNKKKGTLRNECRVCTYKRLKEYRKTLPTHYYLHKQYLSIKTEKRGNRKKWSDCMDFTKFYLYRLFIRQGKKCALSGITLDNQRHKPSIDRINSNKGYTKDNIQIVSSMVNFMKQDYKQDDFINMCKMIAKRHG